jgi:hypothetical protein
VLAKSVTDTLGRQHLPKGESRVLLPKKFPEVVLVPNPVCDQQSSEGPRGQWIATNGYVEDRALTTLDRELEPYMAALATPREDLTAKLLEGGYRLTW